MYKHTEYYKNRDKMTLDKYMIHTQLNIVLYIAWR